MDKRKSLKATQVKEAEKKASFTSNDMNYTAISKSQKADMIVNTYFSLKKEIKNNFLK